MIWFPPARWEEKVIFETPPPPAERDSTIKYHLRPMAKGALTDLLDHHVGGGQKLLPKERDMYQRGAAALPVRPVNEQESLIRFHNEFIRLSAHRRTSYRKPAVRCTVIVKDTAITRLRDKSKLPPEQRSRRLFDQSDELVRRDVFKL
ncbi:MAG: hypothetical protein ACYSTL_08065 [Planctomycetota bacterium]|jgi:hypothetical protein